MAPEGPDNKRLSYHGYYAPRQHVGKCQQRDDILREAGHPQKTSSQACTGCNTLPRRQPPLQILTLGVSLSHETQN